MDHETPSNGHERASARSKAALARRLTAVVQLPVPGPRAADASPAASVHDLDAPSWYLNRELTWLEFNRRVLHEGEDPRTPLLERVKFLSIVHSNLDEFFMKRIGGLRQQLAAGMNARTIDGRTAAEQIDACQAVVRELNGRLWALESELLRLLAAHDIRIVRFRDLNGADQTRLGAYFRSNVFPLLTPLGVDPAHPFPFISNLSLNLLITVQARRPGPNPLIRLKVPAGPGLPRLVRASEGHEYVTLEDLIAEHLHLLLPGVRILGCNLFRVTRNAVVEKSEESADDLLALIESEVRERRFAPTVRLEFEPGISAVNRGMLAAELGLEEARDVYEVSGLMAGRDLMQLATIDIPELHDAPHQPSDHPVFAAAPDIFHAIRQQAGVFVCHPYESFATSVERFLAEASTDPKVLAIKMTLYRTAAQSKIIDHLIEAARSGKHVAVVVELKARFDEAANIRWADYLEEEGIHVSYGLVGLKIHSKIIFVVRHDYDGLRRYAHIGTGNYHAGTARLYSDFGLFTCDEAIGDDLSELFNHLTSGQGAERHYRKLLPAPTVLKQALLAKIEREIAHQRNGVPAHIQFKTNALEDVDITRALYQASQAGVRVDLIVRDTCRLRPGVVGLSENVRVVSIVGRYLEHGRVYYFRNGGDEEYYIGSADCMKRNLESRVEVVTPVEKPALRARLRQILDLQWNDRRSAWDMRSDGTYLQRMAATAEGAVSSQEELMRLAAQALKQSQQSSMSLPSA